ncbi:hypothetical protein AN219_08020, partial [Streptomyces nanshensis]
MHVTTNRPTNSTTSASAYAPARGGEEAPAAGRSTTATVTALHLSAFRALRDRTVPLGPVTVLTGPS